MNPPEDKHMNRRPYRGLRVVRASGLNAADAGRYDNLTADAVARLIADVQQMLAEEPKP